MNSIEAASKTLADLQDKLTAARAAAAEIADAAKTVSFDVFTSGGEARKRLDELNKQGISAELEIRSLQAAIGEAQSRLKDAEAAVALESEREKARQCAERLPAFKARAKKLDKLLSELKAEMDGINADAQFFAVAGVRMNTRLVDVATHRAFHAAVDIRSVPPGERHTFSQLISNWAPSVERFINERIGGEKKEAA